MKGKAVVEMKITRFDEDGNMIGDPTDQQVEINMDSMYRFGLDDHGKVMLVRTPM